MAFSTEAMLLDDETTLVRGQSPAAVRAPDTIEMIPIVVDAEPAATTRDADLYATDLEETHPFIDASDAFCAIESMTPYPISRAGVATGSSVLSSSAPTPRFHYGR